MSVPIPRKEQTVNYTLVDFLDDHLHTQHYLLANTCSYVMGVLS